MTDPKTTARIVPELPRRHGYHWVRRYRGGPAIPICWFPDWHVNAGNGWGQWSQPDRENEWEYLGLCVSPEEDMNRE